MFAVPIGILFLGILYVIVGIWIYRDAVRRGNNGETWLFMFILGNVIIAIIWYIVRPPIEEDVGIWDFKEHRKKEINNKFDSMTFLDED